MTPRCCRGRARSSRPAWVPWSERLRPGDLGVGDLLPTAAADPRLALRAADVERLSDEELFIELGLGRSRVLSFDGRFDAAERWLAGEPGPESALARAAPARCRTCGFHVRLVGALGRMFGVCANEFAPDDSRVTAFDHGCGAHSEALVLPSVQPQPVRLDDDTEVELVTPKTSDEARTEVPAGASGERARRGRGGGGVRPFLTGCRRGRHMPTSSTPALRGPGCWPPGPRPRQGSARTPTPRRTPPSGHTGTGSSSNWCRTRWTRLLPARLGCCSG